MLNVMFMLAGETCPDARISILSRNRELVLKFISFTKLIGRSILEVILPPFTKTNDELLWFDLDRIILPEL